MSVNRSLITPTSNPLMEQALRKKLQRRAETTGGLGELEPLAVRLGLIQNTLKPRFRTPQIAIFAADHGLAVDGMAASGRQSTAQLAHQLLTSQLPVAVFSRIHGLELSVVDCGVAESVAPHARLLARKIAHGTRNSRVTSAMSIDQAHAAIRAGMEDAVVKLEASYVAHRRALDNARADDADAWKQFNLVTVARLIARAALRREESRGAHYRQDFPERDDVDWKVHLVDHIDTYGEKRQA